MSFMTWIIEKLNDVSDWFYVIYLEVRTWIYPFYYVSDFFYELSGVFNGLAWDFYYFSEWVGDVSDKITKFFTEWDLELWFSDWKEKILAAWDWVRFAWSNVTDIISDWWLYTQDTVLGWIDTAKQELLSLVNSSLAWLASLQAAWDNFKSSIPTIDEVIYWWSDWSGNVLSVVNTWWAGQLIMVRSLIDTAFIEREPFWSGWQDWRDKVAEFFADPLEFLWARFTDWFLGSEV